MRELFCVNGLFIGEVITKLYKYSFCGKMILNDKRADISIIAYVIDETNDEIVLISRSRMRIESMKPWYNDSNPKLLYSPHGEYTRYVYSNCNNFYYDILEYYPVQIHLNQGIKLNFRMISNLLVVKRLSDIKVVD